MLYAKCDEEDPKAILKPLSEGSDDEVAAVANELFQQYWSDFEKLGLFDRFKENETYLDGKHWDLVPTEDPNEPRPHTPVLWSTLDNIHADLVEAYPKCSPKAETVKDEAAVRMAGDLQNASFARRGFKKVWRQVTKGVLDQGVDFIETFWDKTLYNGLGDANYRRWSVRNMLFDPHVGDLNDSAGVFTMTFERERSVFGKYQEKREKIKASNNYTVRPSDLSGGKNAIPSSKENDMVLILNFYWREFTIVKTKIGPIPKYRLCWAKIAGGTVVERPKRPEKSVYAHGDYPFTPIPFEEKDGSLFPLGLVDRFKKMQWYIDKVDQGVLCNMLAAIRSKLLCDETAGLDMDALTDWAKNIVKGKDISEKSVRWFETKPFTNAPMMYAQEKAASMKDESGANQFNRGEGGRGVTAASAIYALQDAGSKRSRKLIDMLYDAVGEVCWQAIELQYEFYTEDRLVAITDDGGEPHDVTVNNATFKSSSHNGILDMRMRMSAEQDVGYKTALRNQQAIEIFNAQMIDSTIALQMMDFPDKDKVMALIKAREESEIVQLRQALAQTQAELQQTQEAAKQAANFRPPIKQAQDVQTTGQLPLLDKTTRKGARGDF